MNIVRKSSGSFGPSVMTMTTSLTLTHHPVKEGSRRSCTAPVLCSEMHRTSRGPRTDPPPWWWHLPRRMTVSIGVELWSRWCQSIPPEPRSSPGAEIQSWPFYLSVLPITYSLSSFLSLSLCQAEDTFYSPFSISLFCFFQRHLILSTNAPLRYSQSIRTLSV